MKFIFIYDSTELRNIGRITATENGMVEEHVFTICENNPAERKHLYDVAIEVENKIPESEPCLIFIDQYLSCADESFEWLQRNAGIALIKFLRMLEVRSHIVLITPFAGNEMELVHQSTGNLIVTSKGVSFARNLYEFCNKTNEELETLFNITFDDKQDLKPYILAEFRLPEDERHNWANWWGVLQLTDIHKSLFPNEFNEYKKYPADIDKKLKLLKNVQALFLFHQNIDFTQVIDEVIFSKYEKQKKILESEIDKLEKRVCGTGKNNPKPDNWFDFIRDRECIVKEMLSNNKESDVSVLLNQIQEAKASLIQGDKILSKKREDIKEIEKKIRKLKDNPIEISTEFKNEISKFRFTNENKPKIVYIDDNADNGWSEIIQVMIYGGVQDESTFKPIHDTEIGIDLLFDVIRLQIEKMDAHLILLDLRLKTEGNNIRKVDELSGAQILKKIRKSFPGLPVMMITASNKIWSYQTLFNLGADAYWVKEGLDVATSLTKEERATFSIKNYRELLRTIYLLSKGEYQFLKRLGREVLKMFDERHEKKWWWKEYAAPTVNSVSWDNTEYFKQTKNFDRIFDVLMDGIHNYRRYLQQSRINENNVAQYSYESSILRSQLINRFSGIVESIHFGDGNHFNSKIIGRIDLNDFNSEGRKDYVSWYLLQFRNHASHFSSMIFCNSKHLISYISGLIAWLSVDALIKVDDIKVISPIDYTRVKNKKWWSKGRIKDDDIVNYFESAITDTAYYETYKKLKSFNYEK